MKANIVNIPLVKVAMPPRESLLAALESVLYSGMIAEGEQVYAFETSFAAHFGLSSALATSSGTAALHIAMLLAGVNPGDEVITTSMTAEPTNTTILQVGAIPIFADVDPLTGNLDPEAVQLLVTEKTKAICVVHYAGYPANLSRLREIADRHDVKLIEDCAHALGAIYGGRPIGTIGDFAIFSFQAIKHMTTIDGGVLVMRDADRMDEAKRLRWFGLAKGVPRTEVDIKKLGFKYNMNNVTATIGLHQLCNIHSLLDRHRSNGQFFDKALQSITGLTSAKIEGGADPTYWLYTLLADDSDEIEHCLTSNGIFASKLHRPNHLHSIFEPFRRPLPELEKFYRRLVHIPCGWWVSDEDRLRISSLLRWG
jgi:dTDP-4-amino-4,6-dideoxygalactose transaminase